ncbi:unnamed protein product [Auanema sp. JU1783]|nr:unnamed protein product [Auanema sp. JU1783]
MESSAYFFGEEHTVCHSSIHVAFGAKLILLFETFILFSYVIALPLTIGYFDTIAVFQLLFCGSALALAILAIVRKKHRFLWPFIILKACEVVAYVMLFVLSFMLALVKPSLFLHLTRWRLRTVTHDNELIHIVGVIFFFLFHFIYSGLALHIIYNVYDYFRNRTIFIYFEHRRNNTKYFM